MMGSHWRISEAWSATFPDVRDEYWRNVGGKRSE
jgi:hypothetical protein